MCGRLKFGANPRGLWDPLTFARLWALALQRGGGGGAPIFLLSRDWCCLHPGGPGSLLRVGRRGRNGQGVHRAPGTEWELSL